MPRNKIKQDERELWARVSRDRRRLERSHQKDNGWRRHVGGVETSHIGVCGGSSECKGPEPWQTCEGWRKRGVDRSGWRQPEQGSSSYRVLPATVRTLTFILSGMSILSKMI